MRILCRLPSLVWSVAVALVLAAASPAHAASILLVTNNNGSLTGTETTIRNQLIAWGYTVNTVWDNASQATYDAAFPGNVAVYVPRDVSPNQIDYKLRETTLGVISEEQGITDTLGLSTANGATSSSSTITITNNAHYITNPFPLGALTVATSSSSMSRLNGTTASGATVLGTVSGNNGLVTVASGATLANTYNGSNTAFGRRLNSPINMGNILGTMTANGVTLVQRAVEWAAGLDEILVAHWKLNESSGTSAADATGNGYTGTVTGTSTWAAAVLSNGFTFNGSTKIQATGLMGSSRNVTIAAWANLTTADSNGAEVVSLGDHFMLRLDEGTVTKVYYDNGSGWSSLTLNQTFAGTGWHHFAAVFDDDNNTIKLYVDGVQAASGTVADSIVYTGLGSNTVIGRNGNSGTTSDFTGSIDDVRVYNYALDADDVAELYGFVGHWNLGETSGTTAADSTVFADNGTVTGGAGWSTDCGGNGVFDFNGSSQYISIANAAHLQPTGMLSIAAWVKGDSWGAGSDVDTILRKGEGNPNNYQLDIADGRVELVLDGNDDAGAQSATTLSTGQWYHVVGTWDGATVKIYIDGVLNSSTARAGTIATDSRPLYIGGRAGADFFDGMVRDVRFYNRPLLQTEITKLAGARGLWKFNEGSGSTAADTSGTGNNATLSGGATWTTDCVGNNNALLTNGAGGIAQTNGPFTPPDVGTVLVWLRSTGSPAGTARIFGNGPDWEMRQNTDGTISVDLCGDATPNVITTMPINEVGRWYHIAATFDSSNDTYAIYVDGVLDKSGTNSNPMTQQPAGILSFGTRTGSTEYWSGAIRDFRVYGRKLCPTEIAQICGLVGEWKLNETAGTTAYDSSGIANNGTYQNSVTLAGVAAPLNGDSAAVFDGNNDYVSIGNESNYDITGPLTIATWIKVTSFTKTWQAIFTKGDSAWRLSRNNTGNTIHFACTGLSQFQVNGVKNVNDAAWHHIAGVYDGNSLDLYVDGVLDATVASTGSISTNNYNVEIGRNGQASGREFHGAMYDSRVYSRALCPSEIADLFNGGAFEGVKIIKWVEIQ